MSIVLCRSTTLGPPRLAHVAYMLTAEGCGSGRFGVAHSNGNCGLCAVQSGAPSKPAGKAERVPCKSLSLSQVPLACQLI